MNFTEHAQRILRDNLSLEDLLPTRMPIYVNSLSYLFGASALSALVALVVTGVLLSLFGPEWYHGSRVGSFVNGLHFWGVQMFFGTLLMHLLTKFLMAGDGALFTREDAVEAAWAVVDPVLTAHARVRPYRRGGWGPKAADALIAIDGGWHNPKPEEAIE